MNSVGLCVIGLKNKSLNECFVGILIANGLVKDGIFFTTETRRSEEEEGENFAEEGGGGLCGGHGKIESYAGEL